MSDIDAVIELLERWRDATGMDRMRIGIDATRTIAQLPPARKRALAIEVAERVAPQLVPAIRSEDGDLTTQQVGAVVDLLRRADREQLDDLVTALRTGEVVEALDLVEDAVAVVAPPDPEDDTPAEDVATEAAAPTPPAVPAPPARPDGGDGDQPAGEPPAAATAGAATAAAAGGVAAGGVAAGAGPLSREDEAAVTAAVGDDEEIEVGADGSLELDEEAVRQRLEAEAAEHADRYRDSSRDVPLTPAYRAPHMDFISDADLELPDPSVESVAPLEERMARRTGDTSYGRRLAAPPVSAVVASITATPDGYRRRRAAMEAIRSGRMEHDDVAPVVRSLERATDRAWIAGAALDAGLLPSGELDGLGLSATAVARLRRRVR